MVGTIHYVSAERPSDGIPRHKNHTEGTDFMTAENTDTPLMADCSSATCSARPTPKEIAQSAWDNGHVPTFLKALCELLMCADPWPASPDSEIEVKTKADEMARKLGFSDWVEAYHGL